MKLIKIGIIVNTHGLKGELRIISDFDFKQKVFVIGNKLYLKENEYLTIESYRKHKNYDMVTLSGINSIEEAAKHKGKDVYFDIKELDLQGDEILDQDLIGLDVFFENNLIGKINAIELNAGRKLFVINAKLIPYNENFIEEIDIQNNKVILKNIKDLI